jgi:hypothetical protein
MRRFLSIAAASIAALASAPAVAGSQEDRAAAEQIATILRDSGQMRNYSVGVKYTGGTVWLSGRVADEEQLQAALNVISEIEGVDEIVNNLAVSPGQAGLQQPMARKTGASAAYARRVSASSEMPAPAASMPAGQPMPAARGAAMHADSQVTPTGYHRLAARKAARHACPPTMYTPVGGGANPPAYDQPYLPNYAWPSYAAYPNYAALTYPQQYSPTAWPFIGPFYPYPQVPLGWRKVALEWDDGWWFLDFYDRSHH